MCRFAFSNCISLKEISIPSSLIYIYKTVCLSNIYFDFAVKFKRCFEGCKSLVMYDIPYSNTFVNEYVFSCCSNLKPFKIQLNLNTIFYSVNLIKKRCN